MPPIQSDQLNQAFSGGQGTPSPLSPTPSPAGSVGSVGSQSSGYSSGELGVRNNIGMPTSCMLVPLAVYNAMTKQNQHLSYLISYQDLWDQADSLVIKGKHRGEFFKNYFVLCCEIYFYSLYCFVVGIVCTSRSMKTEFYIVGCM